jgi:threonine dehydratase
MDMQTTSMFPSEIVQETPLTIAVTLSSQLGVGVVLKREDLQQLFSFKIWGAYNKMANIAEDAQSKGVVACSSGIFTRKFG